MKRFLVLVFFITCKDISFPNDLKPLYISAQLVVGDTVQYVFVDMPRKPEEPRGKGFNDAYVEVSDGETTYVFTPELTVIDIIGEFQSGRGKDTIWLYKAKFSPKPLKTYYLTVIRGKDTARAQTTTPDTFSFVLIKINPDSTFTFINDTVRLPQDSSVLAIWKKVNGAYFYYSYVYNYDKRDSLLDYNPNRYIFVPVLDSALIGGIADSLRGFPPFAFYKDPTFDWGNGNYAIKVWALNRDRHLWGFYGEGNINNAEGVFGAVSQYMKVVYVRF
ncbi:MAG: hypothetical protein ABIL50_06850 [candidate division WOR-3 bacterium]